MQKKYRFSNYRPYIWPALSFLWAGIILRLSTVGDPPGGALSSYPLADKAGHFLEFFVLTFLLLKTAKILRERMNADMNGSDPTEGERKRSKKTSKAKWISISLSALGISLLYGGLIELYQSTIPYRSMSGFDLLANGAGAGAALLIWILLMQR